MQGTSTKSYFYLGLLVSCALLYVLFQGGKVAMMLFIMCVILVSYVLLGRWSGIARVSGKRNFISGDDQRVLEAGTSVHIELNFHIPGYWPLPYVLVKDQLHREGGDSWFVERSFVPDWKRRGLITYHTAPLRRGVYFFGQTECSTEDVFGFLRHHGTMRDELTFRVEPRTVSIRNWALFNQLAKGLMYHSASIKSRKETTQIDGVREYVYGDRISRIHWNASARTGTWKSKEFERESLPRLLVVLDSEKDKYHTPNEFELAVSVAASILKYGQKHRLSSGLLTNSGLPTWEEVKADDLHYRAMARTLVQVEADGAIPMMERLKVLETISISQTFVVFVTALSEKNYSHFQQWLESEQLPGCFFNIYSPEQDHDGLELIEGMTNTIYPIHDLEDLPRLLGGVDNR